MSIRTDLFTYIVGQSTVTNLLGTSPTRFYWLQIPESVTYPACKYQVISQAQNAIHNSGNSGLESPLVQIDILAESDSSAESVEAALDNVLNGFASGNLSGFKLNRVDDFESDDNLWRIILDYRIHFKNV